MATCSAEYMLVSGSSYESQSSSVQMAVGRCRDTHSLQSWASHSDHRAGDISGPRSHVTDQILEEVLPQECPEHRQTPRSMQREQHHLLRRVRLGICATSHNVSTWMCAADRMWYHHRHVALGSRCMHLVQED